MERGIAGWGRENVIKHRRAKTENSITRRIPESENRKEGFNKRG